MTSKVATSRRVLLGRGGAQTLPTPTSEPAAQPLCVAASRPVTFTTVLPPELVRDIARLAYEESDRRVADALLSALHDGPDDNGNPDSWFDCAAISLLGIADALLRMSRRETRGILRNEHGVAGSRNSMAMYAGGMLYTTTLAGQVLSTLRDLADERDRRRGKAVGT